MLGTLAVYLRVPGYDAASAGDRGLEADARLREVAAAEGRTRPTRDRDLAARTDDAVPPTERDAADRLADLRAAGVPPERAEPPARRGRCNGRLERIGADAETPACAPVPVDTDCWCCRDCGGVFWTGSHWNPMVATLEAI